AHPAAYAHRYRISPDSRTLTTPSATATIQSPEGCSFATTRPKNRAMKASKTRTEAAIRRIGSPFLSEGCSCPPETDTAVVHLRRTLITCPPEMDTFGYPRQTDSYTCPPQTDSYACPP